MAPGGSRMASWGAPDVIDDLQDCLQDVIDDLQDGPRKGAPKAPNTARGEGAERTHEGAGSSNIGPRRTRMLPQDASEKLPERNNRRGFYA